MKFCGVLLAMILCAVAVRAEDSKIDPKATDTTAAPDNTATNKRDRNNEEKTAGSQNNNASDLEITQKIRKAVIADKNLSTYAHNIKIITQDGAVTLKGPVASEAEKTSIENKAADIAGKAKVTSQIDVTPAK